MLSADSLRIGISGESDLIRALKISLLVTANSKAFPVALEHMVIVDEQSGDIINMLDMTKGQLNESFKNRAKNLSIFLEPLLIVAMSVFVILVVLAFMMPIIEINNTL